MYLSIRTTIFWNICILMVAAIALISFVVFRISEREIVNQRIQGDENNFLSIRSAVRLLLQNNSPASNSQAQQSGIQTLVKSLARNSGIARIIVISSGGTILAHSDESRIGQNTTDRDLMKALNSRDLLKRFVADASSGQKSFSISASLYNNDNDVAGAVQVFFSMQAVEQQISRSNRLILLYILVDAFILILLGTFLLSRYLVNPVNKLINLTENISKGNFESSLYLTDRNEIGKLAASLSQMVENLNKEKQRVEEHIRALEDKNRQLQQAQQEIIQSEKLASIGRLAAGVAHEIGNPIGIMIGYLDLLLTQHIDEQERTDYLNRILHETERIHVIIRDLLDFAQPSSQNIEAVNLNTIIKEVHSLVSYQKGFHKIEASFALRPNIPFLYADEKQIRQVLVNLILNAVDAMPDGGSLCYTTTMETAHDKEYILFTITDTGEGIPVEIQKKIFDPFFTTKEPGKGTGLGLSNVQRIVDALGGNISITSSPGNGTTFTILFPFNKIELHNENVDGAA